MSDPIDPKALSSGPISAVTLSLPDGFSPVSVVSCQPRQTWLKPGAAPCTARF